jgi:hypothetical protein
MIERIFNITAAGVILFSIVILLTEPAVSLLRKQKSKRRHLEKCLKK